MKSYESHGRAPLCAGVRMCCESYYFMFHNIKFILTFVFFFVYCARLNPELNSEGFMALLHGANFVKICHNFGVTYRKFEELVAFVWLAKERCLNGFACIFLIIASLLSLLCSFDSNIQTREAKR